ncbi:unnamed protein product, partial [Prorocentrum cordatum]
MATRHAGRPPHQSGRTSSPPTFTSRAKLPNGVGAFGPEPRGNFAPVRGWFPFQRWSKRARVDEQRSQCPLQSTARSLWSECVPHELQKVRRRRRRRRRRGRGSSPALRRGTMRRPAPSKARARAPFARGPPVDASTGGACNG